jgi:hypothetical protein
LDKYRLCKTVCRFTRFFLLEKWGMIMRRGVEVRERAGRKAMFLALAILVGFAGAYAPCGGEASAADRERYSITILPQMELLVAVQTQTSWLKQTAPRDSEGNYYYHAVLEFMKPYKEHRAVKVCQELLDLGFAYDAPARFALHLGPLPELELELEYCDYLTGRARGREKLEAFRLALKDLAAESDFLSFFEEWKPKYEEWIAGLEESTDLAKVVTWWEDFTGMAAGDEYHIILCPGTFYHNYGPGILDPATGRKVSYNVASAYPTTGEPSFGPPGNLERLSIHEIGHSFINPAFAPFASELSQVQPLFRKVESEMKQMAYTSVETFLNEQVIRAVQAIAEGELYSEEHKRASIERDEARHFYLTSFVVEQLEDYAANRDDYSRFTDFVPVLLERLAHEAEKVESERPAFLTAIWVGAALLIAFSLIATRHRRRLIEATRESEQVEEPRKNLP